MNRDIRNAKLTYAELKTLGLDDMTERESTGAVRIANKQHLDTNP